MKFHQKRDSKTSRYQKNDLLTSENGKRFELITPFVGVFLGMMIVSLLVIFPDNSRGQTGYLPAGMARQIYFPSKTSANELASRFLAILPADQRFQTTWTTDPTRNALIITAPLAVLSTADQLIPRMDAGLQLIDGFVDVGVVPQAVSQTVPSNIPEQQRVPQYYDPSENRYVRVAWQAENAILPPSQSEMNIAAFGATGVAQAVTSQMLDIAVYFCPPNGIAAVEGRLRTEFSRNPDITIATDVNTGKILVHTTHEQQVRVANFLSTFGVYPQSPSLEQPDLRTQDGTVRPITGAMAALARPAAQYANDPVPSVYSPNVRRVQELEKLLLSLFGDRLVSIDMAVPKTESLTQQTPSRTSWRFTRRKQSNETMVRTCDLQFDFLNQKVFMAGDAGLCEQMKKLLSEMDRQTPQNGNVRRFISIRQSDTKKIKEILDYYNMPTRSGIPSGAVTTPFSIRPVGYSAISNEMARPIESEFIGHTSANPQEYEPISAFVPPSLLANSVDGNSSGIRLTSWQGEGLSSAGSDLMGSSLEGFDPQGTGRGVVGVVPDYMPQILPDLDVVIIDAPEAEYKRIENMIREIEELAKLAEPAIEIYNLKHVNCVMLQGILQQLHTEMFVTKQGRVIIFAMQYPNAILLVGWGQAFTSMKDLINVFDQPIQEPNNMMRVIRLKYASATEVAVQLERYFPFPQPISGGMAPRLRVFPDSRTNSLVVQAAPNDMIQIQNILMELDVNKAAPRLQVKTFRLKNLLAEDLRRTITAAILPSVQGTADNVAAKYPILEILSVDAQSKRLIESGIMTDVSITSDVHNNQLVVTAPEDCMELIEKLIEMLDVSPAKAQIKIFRIMYGDATQLSKTLQSLLPTGGGAMPTVPNAQGEESFVPVRFAIDTRTNCIIAAAAPRDLKIIEALILSLDRRDVMERQEVVVTLRNVQALSIAKAIDDYLTRKQRLEIDSEAMSVYQMFESQVIVIPESITNSLIISATPRYLEEIRKLVESFDAEPPQVVIQVLIAEVVLSDHEEFGIEAGLQDSIAFDRSLVTSTSGGVNSATGVPGYDMVGTNNQGNNMLSKVDPSLVAGQVLNTLGMGRTSSDVGFGGLVLSASSRSVQITLRALRQKNRLQILSRPQITAMDNQQAFILVGQRVPRVDKANMTNYGITSSVTDANVGLILLVTPRVSKEGRVIMEIGAEKSSLAGSEYAIPIFTSGDEVIKSPSIDTIQAMTAVSAQDGETVMLGGLITTSKEKSSRGIPWLSDIPHIGWLFRYDKETEKRKELLIVLTPRVVRNSEDVEKIKRVEASKMTWCLADAMALNGSMGLFDPLTGQSGIKKKSKTLPFLDKETMDELSKTGEYRPENDYDNIQSGKNQWNDLPRDQTPYRVYPAQEQQMLPYPPRPQSEAVLPEDIYRKNPPVPPTVPGPIPVTGQPITGMVPIGGMAPIGMTSAGMVPIGGTPSQTIDLEALARNGYSAPPPSNYSSPSTGYYYQEPVKQAFQGQSNQSIR